MDGTSQLEWLDANATVISTFVVNYTPWITVSLNPIISESNTSTYYQNLGTGEISNTFQFPQGFPITIKAVAPQDYEFLGWSDGYSTNPRSFNPTTNLSGIYASFKKLSASNSLNAYSTNSQRKLVKTDDGFSHYVYESMGRVWYELSTDGGSTWTVMNNGKPLGDGKNPSIDFRNNFVLIAFQVDGTIYVDCFSKNDYTNTYDFRDDIFVDEFVEGMDYSQNSYPVISIGGGGAQEGYFFIVTWRIYQGETPNGQLYGLYCKLGKVFPPYYQISWANTDPSQLISGTSSISQNQSMTVKKDYQVDYNLVWQQDRAINYITLTPNFSTQHIDFGTPTPISTTSGFTFNRYPSISLSSNNIPIISWVGSNGSGIEKIMSKIEGGSQNEVKITVVKNGINGNYFNGGNNVNYVNSNSPTSGDYTVVIWSEGTTPISKWVTRHNFSYNRTSNLTHSGIQSQVSNGSDIYSIKAMVFSAQTSPYSFTIDYENFSAESGGGGIGKMTNDVNLTYGRSGIIGKNRVQFVFNIGDIILADTNVQFIPRPDTILYTNTEELNQVTRSLTFHLDNQSDLYFTNFYYTVNSDLADSVLTEQDAVTFRAELVDANSNEIIGTFDQITYTKENLDEYDNVNYKIDCSGIESGNYYLKLVTSVAGDAEYNLANVQNDDPGLAKRSYNNVPFKGNEAPTTYELSQNYPNPFNPATTINYQVPENSFVTLKVYDILGREVATLVNEQKTQGRYFVNYDASKLASGVYIYQIRANDFVSSEKMILLK